MYLGPHYGSRVVGGHSLPSIGVLCLICLISSLIFDNYLKLKYPSNAFLIDGYILHMFLQMEEARTNLSHKDENASRWTFKFKRGSIFLVECFDDCV